MKNCIVQYTDLPTDTFRVNLNTSVITPQSPFKDIEEHHSEYPDHVDTMKFEPSTIILETDSMGKTQRARFPIP